MRSQQTYAGKSCYSNKISRCRARATSSPLRTTIPWQETKWGSKRTWVTGSGRSLPSCSWKDRRTSTSRPSWGVSKLKLKCPKWTGTSYNKWRSVIVSFRRGFSKWLFWVTTHRNMTGGPQRTKPRSLRWGSKSWCRNTTASRTKRPSSRVITGCNPISWFS